MGGSCLSLRSWLTHYLLRKALPHRKLNKTLSSTLL